MWSKSLYVINFPSDTAKIILSGSDLGDLCGLESSGVWMFNLQADGKNVYVGVEDFRAPEGCIFVPSWMKFEEGKMVTVSLEVAVRPKAIRLRPDTYRFFMEVRDQMKSMERCLVNFGGVSKGQVFPLRVDGTDYNFEVIDIAEEEKCCLMGDLELEIDFVEAVDTPPPPPVARPINFSSTIGPVGKAVKPETVQQKQGFVPFSGTGRSLT